MTAVTRGAYDVAPMFLATAPTPGSGKSHLVDLVALIGRGRPCPVITAPKSDEEMEKRLGALLLEGAPIVSLDNLTRDLDGDMLCQMTERPLVKTRILGESKAPEVQWRGTLLATGNNVTYAGDMVRRGLTIRLDAQAEVPERRAFKFDPHGEVRADRGRYVAAALTIARAFLVSGETVTCAPLGSYRAWSRFAREPLTWLGEPDPVASMDRAREEDPKRRAAREFIEHLKAHFGTREFSVKELVSKATETDGRMWPDPQLLHPELNALLVDNCGSVGRNKGAIDNSRVGGWLKRLKGQVHADGSGVPHRIIASEETSHGTKWRLQPAQG